MPPLNSLVGGGTGESFEAFGHGFVREGVECTRFRPKNVYSMRFLPALDFAQSDSPDFKRTVLPYRDREKINPQTEKPMFTPWFFRVYGYEFVSEDRVAFLSPLTLPFPSNEKSGRDPLYDTYLCAKNSKNPDWSRLIEADKKSKEFNPVLPKYKVYGMFNMLAKIKSRTSVQVGICTMVSISEFIKLLDMKGGRNDAIIDPDWEEFLFGDVTSPEKGLKVTVQGTKFGTAGMDISGFSLSNRPDSLEGTECWPVDVNTAAGVHVLESRYNIADIENVTKVWSAEEILELMVRTELVPYDLILEACGDVWTVPPQNTHPETSVASEEDFQGNTFPVTPKVVSTPLPPAVRPAVSSVPWRPATAVRPLAATQTAAPAAARPAAHQSSPVTQQRPAAAAPIAARPVATPPSVAVRPEPVRHVQAAPVAPAAPVTRVVAPVPAADTTVPPAAADAGGWGSPVVFDPNAKGPLTDDEATWLAAAQPVLVAGDPPLCESEMMYYTLLSQRQAEAVAAAQG